MRLVGWFRSTSAGTVLVWWPLVDMVGGGKEGGGMAKNARERLLYADGDYGKVDGNAHENATGRPWRTESSLTIPHPSFFGH